ncbi:MAG TPA: MarR family transcriptional regulator [Steroidobacteraceae bacterium]|nr:MarR family transcriptional regulator [Steroidobacteraceae bacterium]
MSRENNQKVAIADALHAGAIRVLRMVRAEDAASGIGPAQLSALSVLVFMGEKSVGELAALEQVRGPTMTRIVDGLVEKGLVRRVAMPKDRRTVRVAPTPQGRRLLLAGRMRRVRALARRLDGLSTADLKSLQYAAALIARL